ncbi:uncharacterized protein [Heliangelus exortis]|uniref:uncharacterized protein isoform X2 n=1 Tax=Heliangelus exortis TaxID=472823 RepID=UPI003A8EF764
MVSPKSLWCSRGWGCTLSPSPVCRVPMGQQRGQRVSLWRQVLHAGCWWLLSLSRMVLRGLWWLWRLAWCLLICYKSCWDHIFQATEEVMAPLCPPHPLGALESSEPREGVLVGGPAVPKGLWVPSAWHSPGTPLPGTPQAGAAVAVSVLGVSGGFQLSTDLGVRLERGREGSEEEEEEEEDGDSMNALDAGQAGQRSCGEAVLGRLEALEADVRYLCTELGAEKLLWSSRFLELLQEQQSLRQRLQERPWRWDRGNSPELLGDTEEQSGSEGESPGMPTDTVPAASVPPGGGGRAQGLGTGSYSQQGSVLSGSRRAHTASPSARELMQGE